MVSLTKQAFAIISSEKSMKNILLVVLVCGGLVGCGDNEKQKACIEKGINYYKEIGSYPRLTSENISAEDKAAQMCKNSNVAFDLN